MINSRKMSVLSMFHSVHSAHFLCDMSLTLLQKLESDEREIFYSYDTYSVLFKGQNGKGSQLNVRDIGLRTVLRTPFSVC